MDKEWLDGENVFVIHGLLSGDECDRLIAQSEAPGYRAATVGDVLVTQMRNNARVILDDPELAAELWNKAKPFLSQLDGCEAVGLNDRFRFYRYDVAEAFALHYDGSVCRGADEESKLTFMVYLNEGCEGGGTNFYGPGGTLRFGVRPERGMALAFAHLQLHEGAPVTGGRKYALRTDVMYRRPDPGGVRPAGDDCRHREGVTELGSRPAVPEPRFRGDGHVEGGGPGEVILAVTGGSLAPTYDQRFKIGKGGRCSASRSSTCPRRPRPRCRVRSTLPQSPPCS